MLCGVLPIIVPSFSPRCRAGKWFARAPEAATFHGRRACAALLNKWRGAPAIACNTPAGRCPFAPAALSCGCGGFHSRSSGRCASAAHPLPKFGHLGHGVEICQIDLQRRNGDIAGFAFGKVSAGSRSDTSPAGPIQYTASPRGLCAGTMLCTWWRRPKRVICSLGYLWHPRREC